MDGYPLENDLGVSLTYRSPDGEEVPEQSFLQSRLFFIEDNKLSVEIEAVTDKPTVINLTNHTYFNLAGEGDPTILDHLLTLPGTSFVATDTTNIPTNLQLVAGTPFDFRTATVVGARIEEDHPQLARARVMTIHG